jgi:hypothetical protein
MISYQLSLYEILFREVIEGVDFYGQMRPIMETWVGKQRATNILT